VRADSIRQSADLLPWLIVIGVVAAVRVRQLRDQCGGLRAPCPRQDPALTRIKELHRETPRPATSIIACCSCRARDVTGSCQSSVETRP
jgi:hypothetical protein